MAKTDTLNTLSTLLADGSVFYQKLRHYHWHVKGPRFFDLHEKFEELYLRWAVIVDDIAERIVTRGERAPATLAAFLALATLKEDQEYPKAPEMVARLAGDLEHLVTSFNRAAKLAAGEDDDITANLCEDIRDEQDKNLWMLRAWLEE